MAAANDLSAFEREVLARAWAGRWHAIWEIIWLLHDFDLPDVDPDLSDQDARDLAESTLKQLVHSGLIALHRYRFDNLPRTIDIAQRDVDALLADDENWVSTQVNAWHIRFFATKEGIRLHESLLSDKSNPAKIRTPDQEPSMEWTLNMVREYLDCDTDLYAFVRSGKALGEFYKDEPDDPLNRLCYFWREAGHYGWRVLRWGGGDEERFFRGYVATWLDALQCSDAEWKTIVGEKGHPLDALEEWSAFRLQKSPHILPP